ncbi:Coat F domain-containing protein [Paenibacillus uliginis N3/975]|uniref:Coat F domain-containing protein n=1 Tax=Paenibacillus uliginis N3/975 TaxID=1313296 RepID=A0A1X7GUU4_9BACL|nr:spore coat protein [Paenibacillus uliginis]SMF75077.1 Coat F domain-containing protein [Paenibacillus uliginis N3/975]
MPSPNEGSFLPEEDLLNTILDGLKRTVSEYTTATTESACPTVRSMFSNLTAETLKMQGEMYQLIEQQNQYAAPVPHAMKSDVDKQLQEMQNTVQQTRQLISQKTSGLAPTSHAPNVPMHQSNVQPTH